VKQILWLSHFIMYPPHGGARIRSFNLLRELSKEFKVDVFALDPRSLAFPGRDPESERAALLQHARSLSVFHAAPTFTRKAALFLSGLARSVPVTSLKNDNPRMRAAIRTALAECRYDAIHMDTIELSAYLDMFQGIPVVMNHHNVESQLLARSAKRQVNPALRLFFGLQARRMRHLEEFLLPRVAANLAVSELDLALFTAMDPASRVTVVLNGVDTTYHRPNADRCTREATTLVWAGGMNWFPNRDAVEFFLESIWPTIARENPSVRALIVGPDPPRTARTAFAAERIEATGYVQDVREYLARGDIYVVPIRVGGGTRLKILDAFASGIPVVSTHAGCEGIEARDDVELLVRDTPDTFARAVLELVADRERRNAIAAAGRNLVEKRYSWTQIGTAMRATYMDVIGATPRPLSVSPSGRAE
jgi:polysaccharide biosynthesis protein PslH